jgi:Cu2+-exporting ATPase
VKTTLAILALSAATLFVAGAIVYAERTRPRELVIPVKGMVCEGCEEHLREELLELPGVTSVAASHKDEQVTLILQGWTRADREIVESTVKKAGYELGESE